MKTKSEIKRINNGSTLLTGKDVVLTKIKSTFFFSNIYTSAKKKKVAKLQTSHTLQGNFSFDKTNWYDSNGPRATLHKQEQDMTTSFQVRVCVCTISCLSPLFAFHVHFSAGTWLDHFHINKTDICRSNKPDEQHGVALYSSFCMFYCVFSICAETWTLRFQFVRHSKCLKHN